jgi:hypothetical protein
VCGCPSRVPGFAAFWWLLGLGGMAFHLRGLNHSLQSSGRTANFGETSQINRADKMVEITADGVEKGVGKGVLHGS